MITKEQKQGRARTRMNKNKNNKEQKVGRRTIRKAQKYKKNFY
jgi:hypothetical protein